MRVLVVEDEQPLADAIARGLRRHGMAVDVAYDGLTGHHEATTTRYDVVVLDRDLPGMHGDELCADLVRRAELTRVLMLTASKAIADRVHGLNIGADDYLAKPFAWEELVARVQALGRRATPPAPPVLRMADVELDPATRAVSRADRRLDLTPKEFGVLEELLKAGGALVSTEELLDRVWDSHVDPFTSTVRVTMRNLRRKLGEPQLIDNVPKAGYRVVARPGGDDGAGDPVARRAAPPPSQQPSRPMSARQREREVLRNGGAVWFPPRQADGSGDAAAKRPGRPDGRP